MITRILGLQQFPVLEGLYNYGTDICTNTDTKILAFELAAAPLESRDSVLEEKEQKYSLNPF